MKELQEKLRAALKTARDIAAKAEAENRGFSGEEAETVKKALEDARDLKAQIKDRTDSDAGIKAALAEFAAEMVDEKPEPTPGRPGRGKTLGEQFTESDEFKSWMKAVAPNGRIPDSAKGLVSPAVQFKDLITGVSDTSGGAMVPTDYTGIVELLGRRPLTIRDIISARQTGSDLVEYVRQVTRTNNAAPVPEAVSELAVGEDAGGAIGTVDATEAGTKPKSIFTFEKVTAAVKTIAHWVPATKRALSDVAQLRGLIDQELRDGLEEELEDQVMEGDGTGENFTGIGNTSGVQAQAWDTNILTTTRKAKTKVRTVGRAVASAYVLNPADWETIDLLQDNEARYYAGGPFNTMTPRLWGLPVVESEAVTAGVGYVGDFRKAVLWDREQASIQVSDSHADFFVRNLVAILAELRAAFGVLRPTAFVEIDLTA